MNSKLARVIPIEVHGNDPRGGTLFDIKITKHFGFRVEESHWIVNDPPIVSVRGGHFHKKKSEAFLALKGEVTLTLRNREGETETFHLSDKEPIVIEMVPYIHHTVEKMSEGAILMTFSSGTWSQEDQDTFPEFD